MTDSYKARHDALRNAEYKAQQLFHAIESRKLVRAGISEHQLNREVYQLAWELYGIKKYWHKRIVRAGQNTLCPYKENPSDLVIQDDDIMFFDLGPVFEEWEADFGRTFVLGNDPDKLRLKQDVEDAWNEGKAYFKKHPDITGQELYAYVCTLAQKRGWQYGQEHCGHLIGNFPHELIQGEETVNYIHPDNRERMRNNDKNGACRDWILEIHFVDTDKKIGAFFEQLLTVD